MAIYKLTIEKPTPGMPGWTTKKVKSFATEAEADKVKKQLIKKLGLTRQKGFWANTKTQTELMTNY